MYSAALALNFVKSCKQLRVTKNKYGADFIYIANKNKRVGALAVQGLRASACRRASGLAVAANGLVLAYFGGRVGGDRA